MLIQVDKDYFSLLKITLSYYRLLQVTKGYYKLKQTKKIFSNHLPGMLLRRITCFGYFSCTFGVLYYYVIGMYFRCAASLSAANC